jgi:hypothetical protein
VLIDAVVVTFGLLAVPDHQQRAWLGHAFSPSQG